MVKWTILGAALYRDGERVLMMPSPVSGGLESQAPLRERIAELLNATEPGGVTQPARTEAPPIRILMAEPLVPGDLVKIDKNGKLAKWAGDDTDLCLGPLPPSTKFDGEHAIVPVYFDEETSGFAAVKLQWK
jgi:hypothetical protein